MSSLLLALLAAAVGGALAIYVDDVIAFVKRKLS